MSVVNEISCRKCTEMVPENCVRCPFCRSFMRADMEEFHRKQQQSARPVIYSSDPPPASPGSEDDTATE